MAEIIEAIGADIDPVTMAVVMHGLEQVATQMDTAFISTGFSPVIAEGKDTAAGIYHPTKGDVIVQGEESMPIFITAMQDTVAGIIASGRNLEAGDVAVVNDPYRGGTHLMDVKMVRPYFYGGRKFGYLANTGHWPDIGGSSPGGFAVRATEMYQEGLRLRGSLIQKSGVLNDDVLNIILDNVRVSDERMGDIYAQLAALDVGDRALTVLLDRFGVPVVEACIRELRRRSELQVRDIIRSIPDGVYSFEDFMDNDGVVNKPIRIAVDLTVDGDTMVVDFGRSSPPNPGPINAPYAATVGAVHVALKHTFPEILINSGSFVPVQVVAGPTTCLNAQFPRPTSGCAAELSQRIIDVVLGALVQAVPDLVGASSASTVMNCAFGGYDDEQGPWVMYMFNGGGYGGYHGSDGLTYGASTVGTSRTYPMEVFEMKYPLRIREFRLNEDSAGHGRWRGGFGIVMEVELLRGTATVSILGDRALYAPKGALGGLSARCAHVEIVRADDSIETLPFGAKAERVALAAGDRVRLQTPGGGGYGDPRKREPHLVEEDVRRGYFDASTAREVYGIAVASANGEERYSFATPRER
jgi:N-methylhydantoinase B